MVHTIVIILTLLVAILLIGIVLIQKSKGGGLSSQFGGANSVIGVRQTNDFLEKGTWWLAGIIVVLSIISAYTMPQITGSDIRATSTAPSSSPAPVEYAAPIPAEDNAAPVVPTADQTPTADAENQGE